MTRGAVYWRERCLFVETSAAFRFEIHWTTPLFPLCLFCWTPLSYALAIGVVLAHEAGHAALARWRRRTVYAIRMHGFGGHCMHEGGSALDEAWIAWGGILAQLPLLLIGAYAEALFGARGVEVWFALFFANLLLIIANIAPIGRLDGTKAWTLPRLLWQRRTRQRVVDDRWAQKDRAMWESIERAKRSKRE
jgi:Zn-dependent protease